MHRVIYLLLVLAPLVCIMPRATEKPVDAPLPVQTWNPQSFAWSTALIWVERPIGITLTTGVLVNKDKRLVLATRHALEKLKADGSPDGVVDTVYIVWPRANPQDGNLIETSDTYFQARRKESWQPTRVIAQDLSRDLVLLQAPTPAPAHAQAIALESSNVPAETVLHGVSQPFTRGGLWHAFTAQIQRSDYRRLTYSPANVTHAVALYVATGEQPVEFGYSGSPLVLPHSGKLVGILLAAQIDQPRSYVLISSQEILGFLQQE